MTSDEAGVQMIAALEQAGLPFMVVGSLSSNFYGVPRSTKDADFVVQFDEHSIQELMALLSPAFRLDRQISFESITGTTRYIVDVPEIPFRIELFRLSKDPHDLERFKRRILVPVPQLNTRAWLPTPEDVIITKLRWAQHANRSKDRDDIRDVITMQREVLDWIYIRGWAEKHGTLTTLQEINQTA
jgi:hypothetical protein